jgi:hypothetical protein
MRAANALKRQSISAIQTVEATIRRIAMAAAIAAA